MIVKMSAACTFFILFYSLIAKFCSFHPQRRSGVEVTALDSSMFQRKVVEAIVRTKDFLRDNKFPVFASPENHLYRDKFQLAEYLVGSAYESLFGAWDSIGVDEKVWLQAREWAKNNRTVHVKFSSGERCKHQEFHVYNVEVGPSSETITTADSGGGVFGLGSLSVKQTKKNYRVVNDSIWSIEIGYSITVYPGSTEDEGVVVYDNTMKSSVTTSTYFQPFPLLSTTSYSAEISDVLRALDEVAVLASTDVGTDSASQQRRYHSNFRINRDDSACHTPRRNPEVERTLETTQSILRMAEQIRSYFVNWIGNQRDRVDLRPLQNHVDKVFVPVLPVFVPQSNRSGCAMDEAVSSNSSASSNCDITVSSAMLSAFLAEHEKSLDSALLTADALFREAPQLGKLIGSKDAGLVAVMMHTVGLMEHLRAGVDFIEDMLRSQLVSALGKTLAASDFDEYMEHHNSRIFASEFAPKPFTYAIRRGDSYSPEGMLSIESKRPTDAAGRLVSTVHRRLDEANSSVVDRTSAMSTAVFALPQDSPWHTKLPLSAGTSISVGGDKFVHSWLMHRFSENVGWAHEEHSLVAAARQFSSYILVVGRLVSPTGLKPEYAIVVRDKDHVRIPLDVSIIPSAQEFRDATGSMSPEQQQFAQSYRSMQLGNTLLAFAVVQIKPQLELVLNLLPGSLTKEIKLTQDLMELFLEYQIPSDMLSYGGDLHAIGNRDERIAAVRRNVDAMKDMINISKTEQILAEKQKNEYKNIVDGYAPNREAGDSTVGVSGSIGIRSGSSLTGNSGSILLSGGNSIDIFGGSTNGQHQRLHKQYALHDPPILHAHHPEFLHDIPVMASVEVEGKHPNAAQSQEANNDASNSLPHNDEETLKFEISSEDVDVTTIPVELERKYDGLGAGMVIRPAVISARAFDWTRKRHASLLSAAASENLSAEEVVREKNKAFELLDALTRSGGLPIQHASLHVVVANAHSFDKSLMDTVIRDNINPVEKVEQAMLLAATTIQRMPLEKLVRAEHQQRLAATQVEMIRVRKG